MSDRFTEVSGSVIDQVHRRFPAYVTRDDLQQEAAVWWYGKGQRYLDQYLADEPTGGLSAIRRSIYRVLVAYSEKERAYALGYDPRDQYRYSARTIIRLLPVAMDPEGVPESGTPDGVKPHGNLAEGGDMLAQLIDVRRALEALPEDDLHFLTLTTDMRLDWNKVAEYTGTLPDSVRRRHARVAERMARWLAREDVA